MANPRHVGPVRPIVLFGLDDDPLKVRILSVPGLDVSNQSFMPCGTASIDVQHEADIELVSHLEPILLGHNRLI